MGQTSYKKIAYEYFEGIKYFFLGDIGEGYVCGGIDLAAIGVFFVIIAAIIIHFNLPVWVVIPSFIAFSFLRTTMEMSRVF